MRWIKILGILILILSLNNACSIKSYCPRIPYSEPDKLCQFLPVNDEEIKTGNFNNLKYNIRCMRKQRDYYKALIEKYNKEVAK